METGIEHTTTSADLTFHKKMARTRTINTAASSSALSGPDVGWLDAPSSADRPLRWVPSTLGSLWTDPDVQ